MMTGGGKLIKGQDSFQKYSKEYDRWYERNKFAYLSEIEALKKVIPKKGKGLEIGVGTGRFAQPLGISIGLDPSEKMLKVARKRGIKTVLGRGEKLPFKAGEFDFVLIVITLVFIANPPLVISEARRVLKTKGKIIIGIVDKDSFLGKTYQRKKRAGHRFYKEANFYSAREAIEMLKAQGFRKIVAFQTLFHPLAEIKKIEPVKRGFGKGGFVAIAGTKSNETQTYGVPTMVSGRT